jgi:hypothetical protein
VTKKALRQVAPAATFDRSVMARPRRILVRGGRCVDVIRLSTFRRRLPLLGVLAALLVLARLELAGVHDHEAHQAPHYPCVVCAAASQDGVLPDATASTAVVAPPPALTKRFADDRPAPRTVSIRCPDSPRAPPARAHA